MIPSISQGVELHNHYCPRGDKGIIFMSLGIQTMKIFVRGDDLYKHICPRE